jgi:hypothetical protein
MSNLCQRCGSAPRGVTHVCPPLPTSSPAVRLDDQLAARACSCGRVWLIFVSQIGGPVVVSQSSSLEQLTAETTAGATVFDWDVDGFGDAAA